MEKEEIYIGITEDPRSEADKAKDYQHDELVASAPAPVWEKRNPRKYQIFNQDGSSACVANAIAKLLGIDEIVEGREWVDLSRRDIYTRRKNAPGGGMWFQDALEIATKHGACLEKDVPSEFKGESQMNLKDGITPETDAVAIKYRSKGYVSLPIDMDAIASITSQGKAVVLGFDFDYSEWTSVPTVDPNSKRACRHGVACVDNVVGFSGAEVKLVDGKKYLVIDDSWGPKQAKHGQRWISEEFLKFHCFYAGYTLNLILGEPTPPTDPKPHYTFKTWLKRGNRNADVVALQNILKYEGMFPKNVDSTGYYGAVTQKGVKAFQIKYVGSHNEGVQAGPKTIAKLNELYSQ